MSEHDRALLLAFAEGWDPTQGGSIEDAVDSFLASIAARAQPEARTLSPLQLDLVHASVQEGYKPPAPPVERFWRVVDPDGSGDHWVLEIIDAHGVWQERPTYYPPDGRDDAVRDGMALALPEWRGGK